ncbi:hypothetical protein [Halomonas urumqiensis]|uniref:Uncharacterized protein n=1 Tax=Halomonas urumqiensis TaxID=1684789 RepID=A0A2N7UCX9_9GAMM|nr:hypothetical protein [Halomonas urumqiensis]PMR78293.1 hypothetical protein C1H70_16150 [Halomonas urumqiensis]PTB03440.1 hypothetical protein C6V82_02785 [Halomonas urumqiensis]GHE20379.1 hypothetical protein GCM10017767_09000 [Halomonas urumqiensis]
MTLDEIQQGVLNHWLVQHRKALFRLTPVQIQSESMGSARLARQEMDSLIAIGLDKATAWSEAMWLVLQAPPTPEEVDEGAG